VDSKNLYAPKSSKFPRRKASRNVLASRSFTPGSPWALGIVIKDYGSNLALGITIVKIRLIDWFIAENVKALVILARMVLMIWLRAIDER
jgi:hypothetical protein